MIMSKTHWKKLTNPDYLGAYAIDEGKEIIATIKSVSLEKVIGADGKKEDCTVIRFSEQIKPMIINATNAKIITKLYKTPYIEEWQGRKIQIYIDKVKAFGEIVEALRIRPFIPKVEIEQSKQVYKCSDCDTEIKATEKMTAYQMTQYTSDKYGKALCFDCAIKAAEDKTNAEKQIKDNLDDLINKEIGE